MEFIESLCAKINPRVLLSRPQPFIMGIQVVNSRSIDPDSGQKYMKQPQGSEWPNLLYSALSVFETALSGNIWF